MAFDPAQFFAFIENELIKIIPFFGSALNDMTPEQRRAFLLLLAEAIARGAAEGAVKRNQGNTNPTGGMQ